ncbi:hypothetical protein N7536_007271 [Penicillium majusculum]|nr:hypothetical protein N7536_007271 [Penicillium majusculum]
MIHASHPDVMNRGRSGQSWLTDQIEERAFPNRQVLTASHSYQTAAVDADIRRGIPPTPSAHSRSSCPEKGSAYPAGFGDPALAAEVQNEKQKVLPSLVTM